GPRREASEELRSFGTMTPDLLELSDWLAAAGCTHVAMESTGVYWKPIYNILEGSFELLLVNAQHIKTVPGRKTDVKDSEWIAELLQHGLLRGSFVPQQPERELRELTRYRSSLVRERTAELASANQRFRQLAENIDAAFWLASPDEKELYYVSPAYETITNRSCESLYADPTSWLEALHPEDRERALAEAQARGPVPHDDERESEFRTRRPDGSTGWIWVRSWPVYDAQGALVGRAGIAEDITERVQADQALRESEEKFRAVAQTAADGIISADADGNITYFNTAAESLFGYPAAEVMGRPLTLLMPGRFRASHKRGLQHFRSTGEARLLGKTSELAGRRKDGSEFPLDLSLAAWKTGDGQTAFTGILRDITRRKQAEQALRESEQRFRSAFDHTAVGMALLDLEGRYSRVNHAYCQMLGYTEDELRGRSVQEVTHPEDVAKSVDHVRRLLAGELPGFTIEKRYRHKSGSVVWSLTSVAAVPDDAGNPLYLVAETQDITERKRAEEKLRESETRFRSIFEHAGAGMHTIGPDGRFRQVNPAFCTMLGYSEQELLKLSLTDVTHPDDLGATRRQFDRMRAGKGAVDLVKRMVRKDGAIIWVHVTAVWLTDADQQPLYGVALVQDITKEREAEQLLLKANLELEERVRERTAELLDTNQQLITENTERLRAENIQRGRNRVLQALAGGAPL
ncbi:MAG: PAS domain S-box protein, partial [Myxococcales bacterium]|nr:PAS domain S-box protein [Myxococcales bacterium]